MEFLTQLDLASYTTFIYGWGALGIVSAIAISLMKMMPISNREDNKQLAGLGLIDKKLGWIIMETPILITVLYFYFVADAPMNASVVIVAAFVFHYTHRALIFPHRIKVQGKKMPVSMVLTTMVFYSINGYLIGHYYGALKVYPIEWLTDPRFIIGTVIFLAGFVINVWADQVLINLRKPGETAYKIPQGGLYRYISCPNYFGEIMEWVGFAIMAWSLPAVIYAVWVGLTLFSTARVTHRWYQNKFESDYPEQRKAVIPFII